MNVNKSLFAGRQGFTLIELLIVMAILSILSVIGLSNFQSARVKARDAKRKSDIQTIAKSLEAYANDYQTYPAEASGKISCCDWNDPFEDSNGTLYAAKLPIDDLSPTQVYIYSGGGASYTLYARLENTNDLAIIATGVECGSASKLCNYKITSSNLVP